MRRQTYMSVGTSVQQCCQLVKNARWADLQQQTAPVPASQMTACAIQTCAHKALRKEDSPFRGKYNPNTLRCDPDCESLLVFYDYDLQSCQCKEDLHSRTIDRVKNAREAPTRLNLGALCVTPGSFSPYQAKTVAYSAQTESLQNSGSVKCKLCKSNQESTSKREGCRTCDSADQSQNRKYRPCFECEPCSELCPEHTFASHDELTQMPMYRQM